MPPALARLRDVVLRITQHRFFFLLQLQLRTPQMKFPLSLCKPGPSAQPRLASLAVCVLICATLWSYVPPHSRRSSWCCNVSGRWEPRLTINACNPYRLLPVRGPHGKLKGDETHIHFASGHQRGELSGRATEQKDFDKTKAARVVHDHAAADHHKHTCHTPSILPQHPSLWLRWLAYSPCLVTLGRATQPSSSIHLVCPVASLASGRVPGGSWPSISDTRESRLHRHPLSGIFSLGAISPFRHRLRCISPYRQAA